MRSRHKWVAARYRFCGMSLETAKVEETAVSRQWADCGNVARRNRARGKMGMAPKVVFLGASVYPRQKKQIAELAKFFGVPQSQLIRGMIELAYVSVFPRG